MDDDPHRVHGAPVEAQELRNSPRGVRCACPECGERFTALTPTAEFCSNHCRSAFNNRRKMRGAELYDLLMAMRYERSLSKTLKVWSVLCRMAAKFREEDRIDREGRKSWRGPRSVLLRHVDVVAKIVQRGK